MNQPLFDIIFNTSCASRRVTAERYLLAAG